MIIQLKKFGVTLSSRPNGKECYNAFLPELREISKDENIRINFDGINTFSPSWADEFLTPLQKEFGDRVILNDATNLSVITTVNFLEQINKVKFNRSNL